MHTLCTTLPAVERATKRRIRAVLFDAVGTLLTTRESVGETYARHARAHGVDVPAARLNEAFGRVLRAAESNLHPGSTPKQSAELERNWWRERVRESFRAADQEAPFDQGAFERCFEELWLHYSGAAGFAAMPGARRMLDALKARGLRLAVLSNFDQRLPGLLRALHLDDCFEAVILPLLAGAAKPDPRIFEFGLSRLGVSAGEALYVGDDPVTDIRAARAVGMHALNVDTLESLEQLPDVLDRWEGEDEKTDAARGGDERRA